MPTYTYECEKGHITEEVRPMVNRDVPAICAKCGGHARKIITATGGMFDMKMEVPGGWYEHQAGRRFNSKAEFREYCKTNNFRMEDKPLSSREV